MRYVFKMRYQGNGLRVWLTPEAVAAAGIKPLAETPVGKDIWVTHDAEVLSCPPMSEEFVEHNAQLLFSGISQGQRVPNHEPPFALDRMHASRQKQIAFNRRILKTEEEVSRINSGLGDFSPRHVFQ
jgi:hypothetical protein